MNATGYIVATWGSIEAVCADDPIILDDRGISEALDDDLARAFE
jgi:hypothetical protein